MTAELYERVLEHEELADLDAAERRLAVRELALQFLDTERVPAAVAELSDRIDGFGPLSRLMRDEEITDILVNGPRDVWIERAGRLESCDIQFADEDELLALIERLLGDSGARADSGKPIAEAQLADGSRFHVVLPPLAPSPLLSIRRFPASGWTLPELIRTGMMTEEQATFLEQLVRDRRTIAISGATGTGKTTLLEALLGVVGPDERVVLLEGTPEIAPGCAHWVSMRAKEPNVEGAGGIDLSTLLRTALRMRPDRIVVGEVRGGEALVALGAMSTGHAGSLFTIHARSPREAMARMTTLALQENSGATEGSLSELVKGAIDIIVQLGRSQGNRRVDEIAEV